MRIPTTRSQPEFILTPTTIHHFPDIATDLTWVNMLKGIAIIGVFYDNWLVYCRVNGLIAVPHTLYFSLTTLLQTVVGPFVDVFIILSGFGLTLAYLEHSNADWSWKRWAWRRITKIIIPYYLFCGSNFPNRDYWFKNL